jgi:indolepyruvate ferredoxin oxidoreductase beta subunit
MAGLGLGGIKRELWEDAVKRLVPQKALEINLKAFDKGYERGSCR